MDIKKILGNIGIKALGTIAPPFGGMAAGILKKTLGLDNNTTERQLEDAIENATPDQVLELKKADQEFQLKLKELDVDVIKLDQQDRDSARDMQTKTNSYIPAVLSATITIGFFGILITILLFGMPEEDKDVVLIMIGVLGTAWTGVVNYYFGSSQGSKNKTELMGKR